jgi:prepilin-type N-terminal cleavage/methylation domain-containing protein
MLGGWTSNPFSAVANPNHRPGFTILELLVVLALLLILAAVTLPSFVGLKGNAHQRAAADLVTARIADARGRAIEFGVAYRLAVSEDGTRIRLARDVVEFGELAVDTPPAGDSRSSEDALQHATVVVEPHPEFGPPPTDSGGWVTIATFTPDGVCREDNVIVQVLEANYPPMRIHVRGIVGGSRVLPMSPQDGGTMP